MAKLERRVVVARLTLLASVLSICSCGATGGRGALSCESDAFLVDALFEGGNFHRCKFSSSDSVALTIRPENRPPINESPWYSFRVSPTQPGILNVEIEFVDGYARYWPKISDDGENWRRASEDAVQIADDGKSMTLRLPSSDADIWISGQELITTAHYTEWIDRLDAHKEITTSVIGESVNGRPIQMARTADKPEVILLIGRQHPPEVSGYWAMRPFVATVLSDTPLARRFRERFAIFIFPLINPDGVFLGHWRHNVNGVDLNRDWGTFTQPETQSVARVLSNFDELGMRPRLMLDFHSTKSNLFYTQLPENKTDPELFATRWLDRARQRAPEFDFKHDAREPSDQSNTKNYFFYRYGIPAITYELGDETDRDQIAAVTPVFAEEMMRTLLESGPPTTR